MGNLVLTLLAIFGTWYLTSVLVYQDGPFKIFGTLRNYIKFLNCFICTALWVAIVIVMFMNVSQYIIFILGLAGAAVIIDDNL